MMMLYIIDDDTKEETKNVRASSSSSSRLFIDIVLLVFFRGISCCLDNCCFGHNLYLLLHLKKTTRKYGLLCEDLFYEYHHIVWIVRNKLRTVLTVYINDANSILDCVFLHSNTQSFQLSPS